MEKTIRSKEPKTLLEKNRSHVRNLAFAGMFAALGVLLMLLVRFPLVPSMNWLVYDAGDIPAMLAGIVLGPIWGLAVLVVICLVQLLTPNSSAHWGFIMHFIASGVLVLIPALAWKIKKNRIAVLIGLIIGGLGMTALMIPLNLIITPIYTKMPVEAVKDLIVPALLPFNLLKALINCTVSYIIFLALNQFIEKKMAAK